MTDPWTQRRIFIVKNDGIFIFLIKYGKWLETIFESRPTLHYLGLFFPYSFPLSLPSWNMAAARTICQTILVWRRHRLPRLSIYWRFIEKHTCVLMCVTFSHFSNVNQRAYIELLIICNLGCIVSYILGCFFSEKNYARSKYLYTQMPLDIQIDIQKEFGL